MCWCARVGGLKEESRMKRFFGVGDGMGADGTECIIRNWEVFVLEEKEVSADANLERRWALVGVVGIVNLAAIVFPSVQENMKR